MTPKMIWANLAVADIARSAEFYTRLGFRPNGKNHITEDLASFLFAENDFVIHFFRSEKLQEAMADQLADLSRGSEVIFSLSAQGREEVDNWAKTAEGAGGRIFREPGEDSEGYYYCVFADPDGHKFNVLDTSGM